MVIAAAASIPGLCVRSRVCMVVGRCCHLIVHIAAGGDLRIM